jgi:hypothetical protein
LLARIQLGPLNSASRSDVIPAGRDRPDTSPSLHLHTRTL